MKYALLLLIQVMLLIPMNSACADSPGLRIYFKKPADWTTPYVYLWNTLPAKPNQKWPGQTMADQGNGWWLIQLPGLSETHLVVSDRGQMQTADLHVTTPSAWYKDGQLWSFNPERLQLFTFPGGLAKSLTLSFDDGNVADRNLVALLNKYGLLGTFHLNSAFALRHEAGYLPAEEIPELYAGHEVSGHSLTHPHLTEVRPDEMKKQVLEDRANLAQITGLPITGFSYPYGSYDENVLRLLRESQTLYSRTIAQTHNFQLPSQPLEWNGSGYQSEARELGRRYVNEPSDQLSNLTIWGHSWDMGGSYESGNNWHACEEFLSQMSAAKNTIWSTTMSSLVQYLRAIEAAQITPREDGKVQIENKSDLSLWLRSENSAQELKPNEKVLLRNPF